MPVAAQVGREEGSADAVLLELVGEVMGLLDTAELRRGLIEGLHRAVPSHWVSLNEIGPQGVICPMVEPDIPKRYIDRFSELADENPLYTRYVQTGDGRAYRFSDVTSREELEATRLYREVYVPLAVRHQIAFTLPSGAGEVMAIALSRGDRDYSDAERDLLNRARPFLIQAYRNALAYSSRVGGALPQLGAALRRAGLTPREADVMRLVAVGGSNRDVAARLGLSDRTVQKHLERAFRKLGVSSRSAASAEAWILAGE